MSTSKKMFSFVRKILKRIKKPKGIVYSCCTKIAILGTSGVGKSTITRSFSVPNDYKEKRNSYTPTPSDIYQRTLSLKSKDGTLCNHQLFLLDTSGALRADFPDIYRKTIETCEAFVLVFSMDNSDSLKELNDILRDIDIIKKTQYTPILVVANKKDRTSKQEATMNEQIANINRGCCFLKTSSDGYVDCFVKLLTLIEKRKGISRPACGVQLASF